jgi:hypothetical protein
MAPPPPRCARQRIRSRSLARCLNICCAARVRFWHKADMPLTLRMSDLEVKQTPQLTAPECLLSTQSGHDNEISYVTLGRPYDSTRRSSYR